MRPGLAQRAQVPDRPVGRRGQELAQEPREERPAQLRGLADPAHADHRQPTVEPPGRQDTDLQRQDPGVLPRLTRRAGLVLVTLLAACSGPRPTDPPAPASTPAPA